MDQLSAKMGEKDQLPFSESLAFLSARQKHFGVDPECIAARCICIAQRK